MSTPSGGNAAPGWYPTPDGQQRYWDGHQWTEHTAPAAPLAPPTYAPPQAARPPRTPQQQRNRNLLIGGGVIVVCFALLLGMQALGVGGKGKDRGAASPTPSVTQSETAAPATPTPTPDPTSAPPAAPGDLAARLDASLKRNWGVTNYSDGLAGGNGHDPSLLNWYISDISDTGTGVANITVQVTAADTTKDEVKLLSQRIITLTQDELPDLKWVAVITADGKILEQTQRTA